MDEKDENSLIITQEGGVAELPVSMQLYQAIYNNITGKTEKVTDTYDCYYKVTIDDVKNLDARICQFSEQYHISGQNTSITIFHTNGSKERFSSFERLTTYNVANTIPIERIIVDLNFLIVLPKVNKPQSYKLKLTLVSGIAIIDKHEDEIPDGLPIEMIMRAVQKETAEVEIEYIDYIVARSMSDLLREWINSLPSVTVNKTIRWWQTKSHLIRQMISVSFLLGATYFATQYTDTFFTLARSGNSSLSKYLIFSFALISVAYGFGGYIGRRIEKSIDKVSQSAYSIICGNVGDKKLVEKFEGKLNKSKSKVFYEILLAFIVGVCSSLFASYLLK